MTSKQKKGITYYTPKQVFIKASKSPAFKKAYKEEKARLAQKKGTRVVKTTRFPAPSPTHSLKLSNMKKTIKAWIIVDKKNEPWTYRGQVAAAFLPEHINEIARTMLAMDYQAIVKPCTITYSLPSPKKRGKRGNV